MSPSRTAVTPTLTLALVTLSVFSSTSASPPVLSDYPSGSPVSQRQLTGAICRGWVEVRSSAASQVVFWDLLLDLEADCRLLLGCNQTYLYALALKGGFSNGRQQVTPGLISVWPHFGGDGDSPTVHPFSPSHLLRRFSSPGQPEDPDLAKLAHAEGTPDLELTSHSVEILAPAFSALPFRTFPEIMAIKRASRDHDDYALRTATQFASALSHKDARLLASLLSPSLFVEEASPRRFPTHPTGPRLAAAEELIRLHGKDSSTIAIATTAPGVRELGDLAFALRSSHQAHLLRLQSFSGCLYAHRLDPVP